MPEKTTIAMWSGPRNISTALMYSFDNRNDCHASDEPLYANFLLSTKTPHPGSEEVISSHESDYEKVISHITGPIPGGKKIWYQKHMSHHVPEGSNLSWLNGFTNCFLIRNPQEVLLSLSKVTKEIDLSLTGLPQQIRILDHVTENLKIDPPILDSRDILNNPRAAINALCDSIGITFSEDMLSWKPGPRECDGIWAKYWYEAVRASSGFEPFQRKTGLLNEKFEEILELAIPLYQELSERRIRI